MEWNLAELCESNLGLLFHFTIGEFHYKLLYKGGNYRKTHSMVSTLDGLYIVSKYIFLLIYEEFSLEITDVVKLKTTNAKLI